MYREIKARCGMSIPPLFFPRKPRRDASARLAAAFSIGIEFRHEAHDRWAIVLPDASHEGLWRYQVFDRDGFRRHFTVPDRAAAFAAMRRAGFRHADPGRLTRLARTRRWKLGTAIQALALQCRRGRIAWTEYLESAGRLRRQFDAVERRPPPASRRTTPSMRT